MGDSRSGQLRCKDRILRPSSFSEASRSASFLCVSDSVTFPVVNAGYVWHVCSAMQAKCLELLNQMEAPSATDPADPKWSKLVTALTKSLDWAAPKSCSDKTPRARAVRALRGMLQCMLGTESQSSTLELASQAINGENNIVRQLEAWGVKSDVFNGMSSNTRFKSEPRKALAASGCQDVKLCCMCTWARYGKFCIISNPLVPREAWLVVSFFHTQPLYAVLFNWLCTSC